MASNLSFFSDQKFRSIFYQTLVIGIFALAIYFIVNTTAYNLEKRNIATGFSFLNNPAGFDISFSPFLDYKSTDTHLKVYFVGILNTLLVSFTGCIVATILGFFVGIIRLSSNWLLNKTAYKTTGGLTIDDLLMNKNGRIVSAVKHKTAKKEKRLEKYGYFAKKGKFGYVKKGKRSRRNRKTRRKQKGGEEKQE